MQGLFDLQFHEEKIKKYQPPLNRLNDVTNWELFRVPIETALYVKPKGAGGRPPFDKVMMFKILILQRYYNLSDEQTEFQINDRTSFKQFLGLKLGDKIPDQKTIWHFKEQLANHNYKIIIGKNLADLFRNQQEYWLEKFKFYREEMSAHLNYDIKPTHISDDERLKDNIVILINKDNEDEKYIFEFNNDLENELALLLLRVMYLYKALYEEENKLND